MRSATLCIGLAIHSAAAMHSVSMPPKMALKVGPDGILSHPDVNVFVNERINRLKGEHDEHQFLDPDVVMELRCVHCIMTHAKRDYMISRGTLLGAARNGFLLPWDSDGDFIFDGCGGDYASIYNLFSPGPTSTASKECPSECRALEVHLFMGYLDWDHEGVVDGVKLHFWQSYPDLLSGNLLELGRDARRKVPEKLHKSILEYIKAPNAARLHLTGSHRQRTGDSYLDLTPYEFRSGKDGSKKLIVFENPVVVMDISTTFPINTHCNVRNFGQNVVETLELSCPADPSLYLNHTFGGAWQRTAYNKFDGHRWVLDKKDVSLDKFLRKTHNYTGPLEPAYRPSDKFLRRK